MYTEETLLAALRIRDNDAFQYLFDTYSDKIYRVAIGLLENEAEAEGVVQDSFLKLFQKLDQFEGRSKISTWLYRVAYNLSIDRLRRRRPTVSMDIEDDEETLPVPVCMADWSQWPERILSQSEVKAELDKAIAALPKKYRIIFMLREIEELSTKEAAKIADISESAAKVRLHRARLFLREHLSESLMQRVGG